MRKKRISWSDVVEQVGERVGGARIREQVRRDEEQREQFGSRAPSSNSEFPGER